MDDSIAVFRDTVARHRKRLTSDRLSRIERQVAEKRLAWCEKNAEVFLEGKDSAPRRAFDLLFFGYMGLNRSDLPIVDENENEIVWRSTNACPTLEACKAEGLDTRSVCRGVYEKPTQTMISKLDPCLRFLRDYSHIRPYADACLERIVRVDFEAMMDLALVEARQSFAEGNKGYGAVIALGGRVLSQAHDTAKTKGDPSLHGEVNAIRAAIRATDDPNLCGAVLFSTCEPCPMCASLAVWANVSAIVFGASIAETIRMGRSRIDIEVAEVAARSPVLLEVIGGVRRDECLSLYE
ncbi:MAG: nucleoside deaminase [Rhodospirillales bacterium]|nr:nucleoside deaminase [Rhodospirillales bacterium]